MLKSILHYNNEDSTSDMNLVNYVLGQNNKVYLNSTEPATLITDNSGATIKINVEPFYSMTKGGMVIQNTSQYNIDLTDGQKLDIILFAQHMSPESKISLFATQLYEADMIMGETNLDPGAVGAGLTYIILGYDWVYSPGDCIQRNSTDTGWNIIKAGEAGEEGNPASGLELLNNTGSTITLGGVNILHNHIALYINVTGWVDAGVWIPPPPGCTDPEYQTLLSIIDLTAGGHSNVTSSEIIYNTSDHADTLNRNYLRGYKDTFGDLPSNINWNRIGDIYIVIADRQLYQWNGSIWETMTDTAIAAILTNHRSNTYTDEKHLTDDEKDGMSNATNPITSTNEVIERTTLDAEVSTIQSDILNNISSFQHTQRFQIAPGNPLKQHFMIHPNMISSGKILYMYLWGYILDNYFMKALGEHSHTFTTNLGGVAHNHYNDDLSVSAEGEHTHTTDIGHSHGLGWGSGYSNTVNADINDTSPISYRILHHLDETNGTYTTSIGAQLHTGSPTSSAEGNHTHNVGGYTESTTSTHTHTGTSDNTGLSLYPAYTTNYSYFSTLQVAIDGVNVTSDILTQLGWTELGDGTVTHAMITTGTGSIDLKAIMTTYGLWTAGIHSLTFSTTINAAGTLESLLYI